MTLNSFLEAAGWAGAAKSPLAGDASSRRYSRLTQGNRAAILMDAPVTEPQDLQSFNAFRAIRQHLGNLSLSAPQEFLADPDAGFILMEDLGDQTLSHLLASDTETARTAYAAAAALIPVYGAHPPERISRTDVKGMVDMIGLTFDFIENSDELRARTMAALNDTLTSFASGPSALSLRDVHGDNLLWLPDRTGAARVGLLDFQDAVMLPEGYDLASLVDDPRRVVPEAWRTHLIAEHSTPERIAALSAQRNLRILGIFRRLSTELGKPSYSAFLPRTHALIARAVEDLPALRAPVAEVLDRTQGWLQ